MDWIDINDELPIQQFHMHVRNGKTTQWAKYFRKKWWCHGRKLHKVTHWAKDPISYPKIPRKDMTRFLKRARELRPQMQSRKFTFGPIRGLFSLDLIHNQSAESFIEEMKNE